MAGVGGKRPGAGRKPGVPNKAPQGLKLYAQQYTERAVKTLVEIMDDPRAPHAARAAASTAILDRGHGRPAQQVEVGGTNGGPIQAHVVVEFIAAAAKAAVFVTGVSAKRAGGKRAAAAAKQGGR